MRGYSTELNDFFTHLTAPIKFINLLIILIIISGHQVFSQPDLFKNLQVSTGFSILEFQSVNSLQRSSALEAAIRGNLTGVMDWQIGSRLGLNPVLPEGFVRVIAFQEIGSWNPFVGLELGVTNRIHFDEGKKLLRETRETMESDISPFYIACETAPLSFNVWDLWRVSVFEIHFGTHLGKIGRTLRLQVGILTISRSI